MTKRNQDRVMLAVVVLLILFAVFVGAACGSDADPQEFPTATTEPVSDENTVNIPNDDDLIVVCWNGFRVFTSRSTYYGGQSVAAVADSRCVTP